MRVEIEITNCRASVFERLLRFLYTGQLSFVDAPVAEIWEVMEAAMLYGMRGLQQIAEATLASMLTVKTTCALWLLAADAGSTALTRAARDFFVEHLDE